MGILSAFVFAAQMINFSIPGTGSSGHLTGSLLLALFLGPHRGFLAVASILVLQCLFFADGGLMALGANIFNMAFFPCFVIGPLLRRYLAKECSHARLAGAVMASALLVVELGALGVALETAASGISDLPFSALTLFMLPVHAALGAVEGLVTAGILLFILKARPDLLAWANVRPLPGDAPRAEGAAA
jgi:cobalt/nickel transport system permease protein